MAHLVLYDGVCGLCDRMVQLILRRDRADAFRFAALQSPLAAERLRRHGRDAGDLDTIYVLADYATPGETLLERGRAVAFILGRLRGLGFRVLGRVLRWTPRPLADLAYRVVARRRYRWFGRSDACPLPTPATRAKFLDRAPQA